MWKVRESKKVGVRTFWEVFKELPTGETIIRGWWKYKSEAVALADRLNKEEAMA